MNKTTIRLHIDFNGSIDVKSLTDLLNSIDQLCLYQALKNDEHIYCLQESSDCITPRSLEVKEVNEGSIEIVLSLSDLLTNILGGLATTGFIFLFKKLKRLYKSRKTNELLPDLYEIIDHLGPDELIHLKTSCLSVLNGKIERLNIIFDEYEYEFEINKQDALNILKKTWHINHYSDRKIAKINFARRSLSNVPIRIYRDQIGRISGSLYQNKNRHPVFFANERLRDFVINENESESSVFYADVEDIRVNGKTKQYEINGISNNLDQPLLY